MTTSLLIRTFKQLSAKDHRALRDFVCCSMFNRRDDVTRLCDYLVAHVDKPVLKAFEPERLHEAAYPGKPFDNKQLRHVMSYLLEVVRKYLAVAEWQTDESEQKRCLVRALRNRGLDHLFEKEWQRADIASEENPARDARTIFGATSCTRRTWNIRPDASAPPGSISSLCPMNSPIFTSPKCCGMPAWRACIRRWPDRLTASIC